MSDEFGLNVNNPGALRHRIQIWSSAVTTPDGIGGGSRTATLVDTRWARVNPVGQGGQELAVAGGQREIITHRVLIRYPTAYTVTADMRVVWNGRTLHIKKILQPDLLKRWLELDCWEGE